MGIIFLEILKLALAIVVVILGVFVLLGSGAFVVVCVENIANVIRDKNAKKQQLLYPDYYEIKLLYDEKAAEVARFQMLEIDKVKSEIDELLLESKYTPTRYVKQERIDALRELVYMNSEKLNVLIAERDALHIQLVQLRKKYNIK